MHKYQPDGALGSSWHPYIVGKRTIAPIQEDETAIVIFLFGQYYEQTQDKTVLQEFYSSLIKPMATFMVGYIDETTKLPHATYDLWEEKFAITKEGSSPRSVSHLSAAAAEAWCVENTSMPVAGLAGNQQLWLRLDYRVDDSAVPGDPVDNSGFTLSGLVDIFSRRPRGEQLHGFEEAGPLRLDSLKRK